MQIRMKCASTTGQTCGTNLAHTKQGVYVRDWKRLHLFIKLLNELVPVFKADFKYFTIFNLRNTDEVKMRVGKVISVWEILDKLELPESVYQQD